MAIKSDFAKLETLYTSILDLKKIFASDSNSKIDDIFNAIKEIDKSEIDITTQNIIVNDFIEAVMKIYTEELERLNDSIDYSRSKDANYTPATSMLANYKDNLSSSI